jgi:hypothetical protein
MQLYLYRIINNVQQLKPEVGPPALPAAYITKNIVLYRYINNIEHGHQALDLGAEPS